MASLPEFSALKPFFFEYQQFIIEGIERFTSRSLVFSWSFEGRLRISMVATHDWKCKSCRWFCKKRYLLSSLPFLFPNWRLVYHFIIWRTCKRHAIFDFHIWGLNGNALLYEFFFSHVLIWVELRFVQFYKRQEEAPAQPSKCLACQTIQLSSYKCQLNINVN